MNRKWILIVLLVLCAACASDSGKSDEMPNDSEGQEEQEEPNESASDDGTMRNISSMELVADMGTGLNLGNTLDVENRDKTFWGNPITTEAMIDAIAQRGFKTIRIPVTWRFHMGSAPDYTIETTFLNNVKQVVDWARENNMYVIINTHHDDPWIIPTFAQADEVSNRLGKVWTQIANHFKDYSDYLIFDTLNEPRFEGSTEEWTGGTAEGRDVVNRYHQVSVDAIRATGGNNATRHLMISTYAASTVTEAMDDLIIPNNDERTIVSIHTYFPFQFSLENTDTTWGTDMDKAELDAELDRIAAKFIANGRPVVLGEWGSGNQNNTEDRLSHATYYAQAAAARGMAPIWWDMGDFSSTGVWGSALFNRTQLSWPFGNIADAIIDATK